jgi:hypothetical protein
MGKTKFLTLEFDDERLPARSPWLEVFSEREGLTQSSRSLRGAGRAFVADLLLGYFSGPTIGPAAKIGFLFVSSP